MRAQSRFPGYRLFSGNRYLNVGKNFQAHFPGTPLNAMTDHYKSLHYFIVINYLQVYVDVVSTMSYSSPAVIWQNPLTPNFVFLHFFNLYPNILLVCKYQICTSSRFRDIHGGNWQSPLTLLLYKKLSQILESGWQNLLTSFVNCYFLVAS